MRRNSFGGNGIPHRNLTFDRGPAPFAVPVSRTARQNAAFRTALWTGNHLQMTLMCIPPCGEIGLEVHEQTDQYIRVEEGQCMVDMGSCRARLETHWCLFAGDGLFVPCGTWHNIVNTGDCPLKLSSVYAPPHHPRGTVHLTSEDAKHAEH